MRKSEQNSPKKFIHKLLIWAYRPIGSKNPNSNYRVQGRSPLDIPPKTMILSFLVTIIIALIIGNIFIISLHKLIENDLEAIESKKAIPKYVTQEQIASAIVDRLLAQQKQLPNEGRDSIKQALNKYFKDKKITIDVIAQLIKKPKSQETLKSLVIGNLNRYSWTFNLIPYFDPISPDKIADSLGVQKGFSQELGNIDKKTWNRYLFVSAIQYIRDDLDNGITQWRRLLQALGGPIQWITFIAALWCIILLVFLRTPWSELQLYLIINHYLPWHHQREEVWNLKAVYYGNLDKPTNYPGMFTVPRLIKDVLNIVESDPTVSIYPIIRERVEAYRNSVEIGEYEIINFLIWAIPTFGFIGTIFGIISAMENAAAIFAAANPIDQAIALDKVSVALGTAFDTSFIALISLVPISFILASTRKSEANFFEELEFEAIKHLPPQIETS